MNSDQITKKIFFEDQKLDESAVEAIVKDSLTNADDGELFLESSQSESFVLKDGKVDSSSFSLDQGFGLRAVAGDMTGYSHSSDLSLTSLNQAKETVQSVAKGYSGTLDLSPHGTNHLLYSDANPIDELSTQKKVEFLEAVDHYIRSKNSLVKQVTCAVSGNWQLVRILKADGQSFSDIRPLIHIAIEVFVEKDGRRESGKAGFGGRETYNQYLKPDLWKHHADQALHSALMNLEAVPAPAGEMTVVLGSGWPGILLHEAVGHGLEGDFNRKKSSAFHDLVGKQVAAKGVTVIDDGTIENRRGSLTIDDEGTPSQKTVLIEDGILVGFMQDRLNARLMGEKSTGNGRRQSYAYAPIPRMTNTYMLNGQHEHEEIIQSVDKGIYAASFSGGQVDITSGQYVFVCTEAYKIENGKLGQQVKGATLIGNGPEDLKKISMIGNNFSLDTGMGTCGKDGQGVPVGVGQPSLRIDGITVGGTEA